MRKVLLVEDDNLYRKYIGRALEGEYAVESVETGDKAVEYAQSNAVDMVLLDVELPGMNGYEVCKKLRELESYNFTPILFLSGRGSLEERVEGYNAGGDDYLVKPFENQELLAKIAAILRYRDLQEKLAQDAIMAQQTAMTALTGTSELGMVVQFVEKSYGISSLKKLADAIFSITNFLGLNTCIKAQAENEPEYFSSMGEVRPIEIELMDMLADHGRIYDFDSRTQFNYPKISILVKNMPANDPEKYGRFKDLIPPILASANEKVISLNVENSLQNNTLQFVESFKNIRQTLNDVGEEMRVGQQAGAELINELMQELDSRLPTLGLDEDQEQYLIRLVDEKITQALEKIQGYKQTEAAFLSVIQLLQHLVNTQNKLVEELLDKNRYTHDEENDIGDMDVDLF